MCRRGAFCCLCFRGLSAPPRYLRLYYRLPVKSLSASLYRFLLCLGNRGFCLWSPTNGLACEAGNGCRISWVVLFWFSICGCIIVGFKIQVGRCVRIRVSRSSRDGYRFPVVFCSGGGTSETCGIRSRLPKMSRYSLSKAGVTSFNCWSSGITVLILSIEDTLEILE